MCVCVDQMNKSFGNEGHPDHKTLFTDVPTVSIYITEEDVKKTSELGSDIVLGGKPVPYTEI